jgi:hypothetical protein
LLTGDTVFATVFIHTVNKKEQQHSKTLQMKTKTLLIAAAALAAGVISSQAQVYSQNIVGYVNVPLVNGFSLVANPLDDGNGNQLTNILTSANLANKSQVITWNGASYDGAIGKVTGGWGANVALPPGTGFFIKNFSTLTTNTFVGSVLVASGSSVTNVLPSGFSLVGSALPYAGDVTTDTNINLASANLANKSQLIDWNTGSQAFDGAVGKVTGGWGGTFPITVGQGFFLKNFATSTTWVQTLQ